MDRQAFKENFDSQEAQDTDDMLNNEKNICKACEQTFIGKDPDDDVCPACKIDEAELRHG